VINILAPPGTSDEHISITQMLKLDPAKDGAIIVTTPQVIFTIVN
jgi:Mrp family chromosome partitioning ATPase